MTSTARTDTSTCYFIARINLDGRVGHVGLYSEPPELVVGLVWAVICDASGASYVEARARLRDIIHANSAWRTLMATFGRFEDDRAAAQAAG